MKYSSPGFKCLKGVRGSPSLIPLHQMKGFPQCRMGGGGTALSLSVQNLVSLTAAYSYDCHISILRLITELCFSLSLVAFPLPKGKDLGFPYVEVFICYTSSATTSTGRLHFFLTRDYHLSLSLRCTNGRGPAQSCEITGIQKLATMSQLTILHYLWPVLC